MPDFDSTRSLADARDSCASNKFFLRKNLLDAQLTYKKLTWYKTKITININ